MEEPINVRYTFVMLIAIADPEGYVIGTDIAICRRLNMSQEEFQQCSKILMKPDPSSNSKEEEGRRVIESDGERGYLVVNFVKYRDMKDEHERREYMRDYMRGYREKSAKLTRVNRRKQKLTQLTHVEEDVNGDVKEEECSVRLIGHLNEQAGKSFRAVESHLKLIRARLGETDVTEEGCRMMIERQSKMWKNDSKMCEYLRPDTLFAPQKFSSYYDNRWLPVNGTATNGGSKDAHSQVSKYGI